MNLYVLQVIYNLINLSVIELYQVCFLPSVTCPTINRSQLQIEFESKTGSNNLPLGPNISVLDQLNMSMKK